MDTLTEARRIATNTTRQRVDAATRQTALAQLRPLDVVQVVDLEADRALPPLPLWLVEAPEEGARVYLLCDWRRGLEGLLFYERRFSAAGVELDARGQEVPKGRVLVVPALPQREADALRAGLLQRWERALVEREAEWRAGMPQRLRALLAGEQLDAEELDVQSFQPTPLPEAEATSVREVWAAMATHQAERAGLVAELAEVAVERAMRAAPLTDGDVALLLARLPADVVTRALALADQLRERFPAPKQG